MRAPFTFLMAIALLGLTFASTDLGWRNIYQINLIGIAFVFFVAGHAARDLFHALERRPSAACALLLIGGAVLLATFHLNEGCRAQLGCDLLRPGGVDVAHPYKVDLIQPGQMSGMVLAQCTDPDDPDRKAGGHAGTPRSLDSTKARNRSTSANGGSSG